MKNHINTVTHLHWTTQVSVSVYRPQQVNRANLRWTSCRLSPRFPWHLQLICRVFPFSVSTKCPIIGERRITHWTQSPDQKVWRLCHLMLHLWLRLQSNREHVTKNNTIPHSNSDETRVNLIQVWPEMILPELLPPPLLLLPAPLLQALSLQSVTVSSHTFSHHSVSSDAQFIFTLQNKKVHKRLTETQTCTCAVSPSSSKWHSSVMKPSFPSGEIPLSSLSSQWIYSSWDDFVIILALFDLCILTTGGMLQSVPYLLRIRICPAAGMSLWFEHLIIHCLVLSCSCIFSSPTPKWFRMGCCFCQSLVRSCLQFHMLIYWITSTFLWLHRGHGATGKGLWNLALVLSINHLSTQLKPTINHY